MTALSNHPWSTVVLPWIEHQRWFPGKGLTVRSSGIRHELPLDPALSVLLVEFDYGTRSPEMYQVPILIRSDPPASDDVDGLRTYIGAAPDGAQLYDAASDPEGSSLMLMFMAERRQASHVVGSAADEIELRTPHPVRTEQSNTSVIFGDSYIMKTLRQLWPGENPDLKLTLALDRQGSHNSARTMAWMTVDVDGVHYTLVTVQRFLAGATMAWPMVQASLRRATAADGSATDFGQEAFEMGVATARVHEMLARSLGVGRLGDAGASAITSIMKQRWKALAPRVPELAAHGKYVDQLASTFTSIGSDLRTQRIHNDLHLTQVMRTSEAWVLIDFEGEPNASIEQRNQLVSPWRDVACMLRSFNYAAFYLLTNTTDPTGLAARVDHWLTVTRESYMDGYTSISGSPTPAESTALRLYEIEKALFEIDYEMTYRPTWLEVAVRATAHLLETTSATLDQ
jgi:maltokinase